MSATDPDEFRRVPAYLRGATGEVVAECGLWPPPAGRHHHDQPREPEPVYTVQFEMADIFGRKHGDARIYADLWLRYLEPVREEAGDD